MSLVMRRIAHDRLELGGFQPDAGILMGGLAIATLAGDHIHRRVATAFVASVTIVTWALAIAWIALAP